MSDQAPAGAAFAPAPRAPVRTPAWRVSIEGRDVTREVAEWLTSLTYTDHVHGASDDVELQVHDSDGRWRGDWLPGRGDHLELQLGYDGAALLPSGRFEVDEVEMEGPPDSVTIRGLAAGPTSPLRTARSHAYEGQTLRSVAQTIADRHGLRLEGEIAELRLGRLTQDRETDVEFLTRVTESLGYAFSVRGARLTVYLVESLESAPPSFTVARAVVPGAPRAEPVVVQRQYRILTSSRAVYRACTIRYHDPRTRQLVTHTEQAPGVTAGDVYEIRQRADSIAHARAVARANLRRLNGRWTEGEITIEGEPRAVAGVNVNLEGFGRLDGVYLISQSRHRITRQQGYETIITVRSGGTWATGSES